MNDGMKKLLPFVLIGGGVLAVGAMYMSAGAPNAAVEKLSSSGGFSSGLFGNKSGAHEEEEDGMLPGRLRRAQTGRVASSQFSDANYGESSLGLVGGRLSIDEALELEGGKKPLPESGEMSSGGIPGAEGIFGEGDGSKPSLFGQGEIGGFDKKSSALDETANYYGSKVQGGGAQSGGSGKTDAKNQLLARGANASGSGVSSSAGRAAGGMARVSRANVLKQNAAGQAGNSKNALAGLKGAAGYVAGSIGGSSNFQTEAGVLGKAIDGSANTGILGGIQSEAGGISVTDLPSYDDPTVAKPGGPGKPLFDWNAAPRKLKHLARDWSSLGDYSEVYADTMGMGAIIAQYLGFPGVVLGYTSGSSSSFSNYFRCGRKKCGCKETYTSYAEVTVNVDGKEKKIRSRASPFTATCRHKKSSCHGPGSVEKVDTIPFGESRFLLIYNYFQRHAKPNPGVTGYLLNINNVRANREPMFVPINAASSRKYNLGPCLRSLASEFAAKCGVGTITQMGLMDKFLQTATETDGGVRGVCVQHYELPRKFEQCVNSNGGEWGM